MANASLHANGKQEIMAKLQAENWFVSIGTGNAAVNTVDTTMGNEVKRAQAVVSIQNNQLVLIGSWDVGLVTGTWTEIALWCGSLATSTLGTGQMYTRLVTNLTISDKQKLYLVFNLDWQ